MTNLNAIVQLNSIVARIQSTQNFRYQTEKKLPVGNITCAHTGLNFKFFSFLTWTKIEIRHDLKIFLISKYFIITVNKGLVADIFQKLRFLVLLC